MIPNFYLFLIGIALICLLFVVFEIRHKGKTIKGFVHEYRYYDLWIVNGQKYYTEMGARIRAEALHKKGIDADVVIFDEEANPMYFKASTIFDFDNKKIEL